MYAPKESKPQKAAREYIAHQLSRATYFAVHLQLAPHEVYKAECKTVEEAKAKAIEFNKLSEYGRRSLIYGITPEGWSIPVPQGYRQIQAG